MTDAHEIITWRSGNAKVIAATGPLIRALTFIVLDLICCSVLDMENKVPSTVGIRDNLWLARLQ